MPMMPLEGEENHLQIVLGYGDIGVAAATYGEYPAIGLVFRQLKKPYTFNESVPLEEIKNPEAITVSIRIDNVNGLAALKRLYDKANQFFHGKDLTIGDNMLAHYMEQVGLLQKENRKLKAELEIFRKEAGHESTNSDGSESTSEDVRNQT